MENPGHRLNAQRCHGSSGGSKHGSITLPLATTV
jgi:hypothetical protein